MTEEALQRAARSVSTLESLCLQFDKCSGVPARTHSHSTLSDIQDVDKVRTTVVNRHLFLLYLVVSIGLTLVSKVILYHLGT